MFTAAATFAATSPFAAERHAAPMRLGAIAAPPYGFMQFCRRDPAECGVTPTMIAEATMPGAAIPIGADSATSASFPDAASDAKAAVSTIPRVAGSRADLLKLINRVNRQVNRAIIFESDQAQYGVPEFWTEPSEAGTRYGDCEDYVLEKRHALIALGFAPSSLSIATVTTSWGQSHALLLVAIDDEEYVLDSLTPWIVRVRDAPYVWRERQVQGQALVWAKIRQPDEDLGAMQVASSQDMADLQTTSR